MDTQKAVQLQVTDLILKSDFSMQLLRQRISEALNRRREKNETLNAAYLDTAVNETLSSIAHELRSPLVTIKRQIEAISSEALGALNQPQHHAADLALRESSRALSLLYGHLELNRLEQRLNYSEPADLDVAAFLSDELQKYQPLAELNEVKLDLEVPPEGCTAAIDPNKLRIALNPLMENAIKFSPKGGSVTVAVKTAEGHILVKISDQGPGMRDDHIQSALTTDTQPGGSPSSRARGTELGLIIARRAAELHGGSLAFEEGTGSGLTAVLSLKTY